jgi:hypothetical protein
MYEFFGALAFSAVVAGYVLAVLFVRHRDGEELGNRHSTRPDGA